MRTRTLLFLAAAAVTIQPSRISTLAGNGVNAVATDWSINAPLKVRADSSENRQIARLVTPAREHEGAAPKEDSAWKNAGADEGLRQAFERAMYSLDRSSHGTWRGENNAQRLTLEFNEQEVRLKHPDGSVSLRLAGYGYGDRLQRPALAKLAGTSNRVEYQRGDLTEWYVNGPKGLEQGFTLAHPPGAGRAGEPLVVALGVTGGLAPAIKADKGSVLFESGNGVVLRYAGLMAVDARSRVLPSKLEVRGREIRLIVNDESAEYPLTIDPTWTQQQELTASDGVGISAFGISVSVSGDTAVIGATAKNNAQGAAYVFVRSGGVWSQGQELTASDGVANDVFGNSVSVSGDAALIAALGKNGNRGAAYVFVQSSGVWTQQQELTASDGAGGDYFGEAVSMSGDTALIGANGQNLSQGAAYVFVQSGGAWTQQQKLVASDGAAKDEFGDTVSVSGDTAVIGAYAFAGNSSRGAAYVFVGSSGVWTQQQELTASDGMVGDIFGCGVSVSGNTAVIGACYKNASRGAAYVFVQSSGVWTQLQELAASDGAIGDYFGSSVSMSMSGDTAVIGAGGKNASQGAAYVFVQSSGLWTQQQELTASDGATGDYFGYSVSVSGDTAVIGATDKNNYLGAAYVFVLPTLPAQSISFSALSNQPFGSPPLMVSATASSGLPVSFASTTPAFCTASGATVTLTSAGTCTIQATQAGSTSYAAATPVFQSFQVTQVSQSVTLGLLSYRVFGSGSFQLSASASSGLAVSFASITGNICTISGATVTLAAVGTCTVQASQAGNIDYTPAPLVNQGFQVTSGTPSNPCDLSQNGNVSVADVQLIINAALGVSTATSDLNGDGTTNVLDVQIETNGTLGLGCTAN